MWLNKGMIVPDGLINPLITTFYVCIPFDSSWLLEIISRWSTKQKKEKDNTSGKIKKRQNHANLEACAHADHAACRDYEPVAVLWGLQRRLAREKDKDTCTVKPRRKRLVGIDRTIVAFIDRAAGYLSYDVLVLFCRDAKVVGVYYVAATCPLTLCAVAPSWPFLFGPSRDLPTTDCGYHIVLSHQFYLPLAFWLKLKTNAKFITTL